MENQYNFILPEQNEANCPQILFRCMHDGSISYFKSTKKDFFGRGERENDGVLPRGIVVVPGRKTVRNNTLPPSAYFFA